MSKERILNYLKRINPFARDKWNSTGKVTWNILDFVMWFILQHHFGMWTGSAIYIFVGMITSLMFEDLVTTNIDALLSSGSDKKNDKDETTYALGESSLNSHSNIPDNFNIIMREKEPVTTDSTK